MTAGNNGAGTPEDDDPFAYLYRSEGGEGGAQGAAGDGAPTRRPGVPRTSYNQVRAVGERQYGGQQVPQQASPQQAYGQQSAHYAAPETLQGGGGGGRGARAAAAPAPAYSGAPGQGPRRNRNGLLIGAIAVVVAVCAGIGAAMIGSSSDDDKKEAVKPSASQQPSEEPSKEPSPDASEPTALPKEDAGSLRVEGGATTDKAVPGARSSGGTYVAGMNKPGASATWTFDVPKSGKYTLFVGYGVPGTDAKSTLTINGKARETKLNMKNYAGAKQGAWDKGWTRTYAWIDLNKGTNAIKISCETGDKCDFNLDQVWLKEGNVSTP